MGILTTRRETILKTIVKRYIDQAIPVASQSLVDSPELRVSSATIRNEMAWLEEAGYILRQHHSAGSIPSERGYRLYVESLEETPLALDEQCFVSHLFHQVERDVEEWSRLAAKVTAQLVRNMAVVTTPRTVKCQFKYLELVSLQDIMALGIFVLEGARIKRRLITFSQAVTQTELTTLASGINILYSGMCWPEIMKKEAELTPLELQLRDYLVQFLKAEEAQEYDEPYLDGLHLMLSQPEFFQGYEPGSLLELVDQRRLAQTIIPEGLVGRQVRVVIGSENRAEAVRSYSVVISGYGVPGAAVGTIGVIGPTRMPYGRAIAVINYLAETLSRLTAELYGKEDQEPTR